MHSSNSSGKRQFNNTAPGGRDVDVTKLDQKRLDDFRGIIKREEEERERKRNQSGGQGRGHSHS